MIPTMMAVSSAAILDACEGLGVNIDEVLAEAGLDREVFHSPHARLPSAQAAALWRAALARARDGGFALRAAERVRFGAYQVIDYIAAASPTVGASFRHLASSFALINQAVTVDIDEDGPAIWVRLTSGEALARPYVEYALAAIYLRLQAATKIRFALDAVAFAFPAVALSDEHARIFGCELRFDAPASGLIVPRASWDTANPCSDPALLAVLLEHARVLATQITTEPPRIVEVRAAIRAQLRDGDASLTAVARRLATSTRSLQRALQHHGLRYADLLETTRLAAAETYLLEPRLSLAEVAGLVGFSQQSSFTRAFRRWTGRAPHEVRDELRGR